MTVSILLLKSSFREQTSTQYCVVSIYSATEEFLQGANINTVLQNKMMLINKYTYQSSIHKDRKRALFTQMKQWVLNLLAHN